MEKTQLLLFKLGKKSYCLNTLSIQGIIKPENLIKTDYPIKLSCLPFYVELMIEFQGKFIPIVDLRRSFILSQQKSLEDNRIIILEINSIKIGIEVDSICNVIHTSQSFVYSSDLDNYSKSDIFSFLNIKEITSQQKPVHNVVI